MKITTYTSDYNGPRAIVYSTEKEISGFISADAIKRMAHFGRKFDEPQSLNSKQYLEILTKM